MRPGKLWTRNEKENGAGWSVAESAELWEAAALEFNTMGLRPSCQSWWDRSPAEQGHTPEEAAFWQECPLRAFLLLTSSALSFLPVWRCRHWQLSLYFCILISPGQGSWHDLFIELESQKTQRTLMPVPSLGPQWAWMTLYFDIVQEGSSSDKSFLTVCRLLLERSLCRTIQWVRRWMGTYLSLFVRSELLGLAYHWCFQKRVIKMDWQFSEWNTLTRQGWIMPTHHFAALFLRAFSIPRGLKLSETNVDVVIHKPHSSKPTFCAS